MLSGLGLTHICVGALIHLLDTDLGVILLAR